MRGGNACRGGWSVTRSLARALPKRSLLVRSGSADGKGEKKKKTYLPSVHWQIVSTVDSSFSCSNSLISPSPSLSLPFPATGVCAPQALRRAQVPSRGQGCQVKNEPVKVFLLFCPSALLTKKEGKSNFHSAARRVRRDRGVGVVARVHASLWRVITRGAGGVVVALVERGSNQGLETAIV